MVQSRVFVCALLVFVISVFFTHRSYQATAAQQADSAATGIATDKNWAIHVSNEKSSLRGLFAIDRNTAWASGSEGTIVQCRNITLANRTIGLSVIAGFEKSEFRSIHAWDANQCIVATAGQPANIFKTIDGGKTWKTVFSSDHPNSFYNGLKFFNESEGVVFGDPLAGCLELLITKNSGESWERMNVNNSPQVLEGEAGFAASNSSMLLLQDDLWIGLGGRDGIARILRCKDFRKNAFHNQTLHWSQIEVSPLPSSPSRGIFSLASAGPKMVAVGGDYKEMENKTGTIALSDREGNLWRTPMYQSTRGFRSCVVFSEKTQQWIAVGPTGTDVAKDVDRWNPFSNIGFHTMHVAADGSVWAAGSGGRIGLKIEQ